MTRRPRAQGFTLIEVMVVVAIIGILVRIAYPIYTKSVLKSHRADAKAALLDLAQREERYMSTSNAYSTVPATLGYSSTSTTFPIPVLSGSTAYYNLAASAPTAGTTFTATATPTGAQTADPCGTYTLDNTGTQGVTGGTMSAADCW